MPVFGSLQKFGVTWKLPASETFMPEAICCSVSPSSSASRRSISAKNSGAFGDLLDVDVDRAARALQSPLDLLGDLEIFLADGVRSPARRSG